MRNRKYGKFKVLSALVLLTLILSSAGMAGFDSVFAQDGPPPPEVEEINEYYTVEHLTMADGTKLERAAINGPSSPPVGAELGRTLEPLPSIGTIADFPSYDWVFGCSAVSGAMIAGYFDRTGYPDFYTGPTNNGKMTKSDTPWPTWTDVSSTTYPNNPLVASHAGVDGRGGSNKGSIDDYWVQYGSSANDPYVGNWTQHTWTNAIGDDMKTSQSAYGSTDGSTWFYNYSDATKLTCAAMDSFSIVDDGNQGRRDFAIRRGYTVTSCWNQKTYNKATGGFSLTDLKTYLDRDVPVFLNLEGHSIVAYGYSGSTVYIRNTWDNDPSNTYSMVWDATPSYSGMDLNSVAILTLAPTAPKTKFPKGPLTQDMPRFKWTKVAGATKYQITLWQGSTRIWWRTVYSPFCTSDACMKKWWIPIPDGSYTWKVRAYKDGAWGPWSWKRWFSVTTP